MFRMFSIGIRNFLRITFGMRMQVQGGGVIRWPCEKYFGPGVFNKRIAYKGFVSS